MEQSPLNGMIPHLSPQLTAASVHQETDVFQVTQSKPKYTGKSFPTCRIGLDNPLYETTARKVGAGSALSIGGGKFILIQRQGDGSYRNSFGIQVPETFFRSGDLQDTEATRSLLLTDFFADWADEYKELVRHSTDFRAWPFWTMAAEDMGWTSVSGVTIAGDAAHLSYPGGNGVNLAMLDSSKLAEKIEEHGLDNLDQAVQEYEADMFARAIRKIAESKVMETVMYSEDPQAFLQLLSG